MGSPGTVDSGSFITGSNPISEDISLFLIQALIIICTAKLVSIPLRYLKQPAVIAEVIGGILLGPSALGRIPAFKNTIFPTSSLPRLKLVAEIGLILYLYLVGLELDPKKVKSQFKTSAFISLAGIAVPFATGVGVSKVIYDTLADKEATGFVSFFVFLGVAMSITAFPVLARILTERKMLKSNVGQVVLAAAAVDDAVAWCLLVLVVALINNPGSAVMAVYVFLTVVAWAIFLWFTARPLLNYLVRLGHENESMASVPVFTALTMVCISAWFTQGVGVHAIFGAFLIGLITPHDHGFAILMTEKIEDLVSILLLPLYFAFSGLKTRFDQMGDAYSWGITVLVIVAACGGKIIGCTAAGKLSGLKWRESFAVGILMNTKGLVELIVLNLGLDAGVITPQIFTIFVVMALFTTFLTVPIVAYVYPYKYYIFSDKKQDPELVSTTGTLRGETTTILACLPNLKTVSGMMSVTQLLTPPKKSTSVTALRLIELSDQMSRVMMDADSTETLRSDAAVSIFRTFGQLNHRVNVTSMVSVSTADGYADNITAAAMDIDADLIVFPVDGRATFLKAKMRGVAESLAQISKTPVAIFVDRGFGATGESISIQALPTHEEVVPLNGGSASVSYSVVFLFSGGADDVKAAEMVAEMALVPDISMTVIRVLTGDNKSTIEELEALEKFSHLPSVNVKEVQPEQLDVAMMQPESHAATRTHIIIVGYETDHSQKVKFNGSDKVLKDWLHTSSKSSFIVVKAPSPKAKSVVQA